MSTMAAAFAQNPERLPQRRVPYSYRSPATVGQVLPQVQRTTSCACGGGCPRCSDKRPSGDFPEVRFHPSSPEVTTPLRARAVTIGQDIYFHPGEFQPGTPSGEALIGHELAHTLQIRQSGSQYRSDPSAISSPGEALERNADALASGETTHVLAAPAGIALRSPFDSEPATDRERRLQLIQAIDNATQNLLRLLRTGGIVRISEVAVERAGVRGVVVPAESAGTSGETFFSYSERDVMIRRIIRTLIAMGALYRSTPISSSLPAATPDAHDTFTTQIDVSGGHSSYGGGSAAWSQLQAAYELYRISQGQTGEAYSFDWYYLTPNFQITPGAARGAPRIGRGTPSGAYMVVPDIDHDPLNYWHLDGYRAIPRGSTIVEFWHDDFGYYYEHNDQRIDVPSPWSQ